jgi:hypothetical protein
MGALLPLLAGTPEVPEPVAVPPPAVDPPDPDDVPPVGTLPLPLLPLPVVDPGELGLVELEPVQDAAATASTSARP